MIDPTTQTMLKSIEQDALEARTLAFDLKRLNSTAAASALVEGIFTAVANILAAVDVIITNAKVEIEAEAPSETSVSVSPTSPPPPNPIPPTPAKIKSPRRSSALS